jgi:hypothetical protein
MDDDELPPWLGTAFQDAFHDIFANQHHAEQHAAPAHEEPTHVDERN